MSPSPSAPSAPGPECAAIQALLVTGNERDLSDFEARRIEQHVARCVPCSHLLDPLEPASTHPDRVLASLPVPLPEAAEWEAVRATLMARLYVESPRAPARRRWWVPLLPVAAGLAVTWLVFDMAWNPSPPVAAAPFAEVSEVPEDQSCDIFLGTPEEGVLVLITSG